MSIREKAIEYAVKLGCGWCALEIVEQIDYSDMSLMQAREKVFEIYRCSYEDGTVSTAAYKVGKKGE